MSKIEKRLLLIPIAMLLGIIYLLGCQPATGSGGPVSTIDKVNSSVVTWDYNTQYHVLCATYGDNMQCFEIGD